MADEDFQVGIKSQDELVSSLETFVGYAKKFTDAYDLLSEYFKAGSDKLWVGDDATALSEAVTRPGGVLEQLNVYYDQTTNMKKLADEILTAITGAQNEITEKIKNGLTEGGSTDGSN